MILDMSVSAFTALHVIVSLIAIVAGLVVLWGMFRAQRLPGWTALFLTTTVLTSVTGFLFPIKAVTPAFIFGVISIAVLAVAILALYGFGAAGHWRWIYVASAVLALYLNVFVLVVQSFLKVPFFKALAPTQGEPPFAIAQGVVLILFIVAGVLAVLKFRPAAAPAE